MLQIYILKILFQSTNHLFFPGAMSERLSDESSGGGAGGGGKGHGGSDSHPDTLTDPEFSDPPLMTSSPPQSGDEHVKKEKVRQLLLLGPYNNIMTRDG